MEPFIIGFIMGAISCIALRSIFADAKASSISKDTVNVVLNEVEYASPIPEEGARKPIRTKVVGVTFEGRQQIIHDFCRAGMDLDLTREPDNPFDRYAIGVWLQTPRLKIGYVSQELAYKLRRAASLKAKILGVTGFIYDTRGVNIEIYRH